MKFIEKIHPKEPLKYLRWFDILILTLIMFGRFIQTSTILYLTPQTASSEAAVDTATEGAAFSDNFTLQLFLLAIALAYLWLRHFDFKQLPIRFKWSVLFWTPLLFIMVGLIGDLVTTLTGEYNYFDPQLWQYIDLLEIFRKFAALTPMAILYGLLNGFYEEFFFLGLLTSVREQQKWWVLLYSTLIRISFHTYLGMTWALLIGVVYGLLYYFLYKYKVKNLLPFFLMHALADMFGSSLMYVLINWG